MSDVFDISTVDGRRTLLEPPPPEGVLSRLREAERRALGGTVRPVTSATTSSGESPNTGAGPGSTAANRADDESRLQRELDRAVLDLASARRTLATYRRGVRALVASVAVNAVAVVAGIVTAIASSAAGLDASTAVGWALGFGWPMALASAAALVGWVRLHRIRYEWIKKSTYTSTTYQVDSKEYVDPQHHLDIAELRYAGALRKLTEHKGTEHQ